MNPQPGEHIVTKVNVTISFDMRAPEFGAPAPEL